MEKNMTKEFVTYEQAVLLKEIGFDENCMAKYNSWGTLFIREESEPSEKEVLAPLYQQAFRWFREKYKLAVDIRSEHLGYYTSIVDREKMMRIVMKPVNIFETYEEAEQACLDKLIEIVDGKIKLK